MTRRAVVRGGAMAVGFAACAGDRVEADEHLEVASTNDDVRTLVYRETDHIRWFYRRART